MKTSIIKRVILTIAAAALFVVPVTIITLQNNTTKTAEASNYNYSNYCNAGDFAKLGTYCPPVNSYASNSCQVMYYSYITNSYSSCTQVQNPNTNYTNYQANTKTNNASYVNTSTNYEVYTSYPYNTNTTPNYSNYYGYNYNIDYSYYNPGSYGTYIAEPYVDIYVQNPNLNNYKLKDSDSQEFKNSYCQQKYDSMDYVFQNWYCVR
jgi:hypothetical protein